MTNLLLGKISYHTFEVKLTATDDEASFRVTHAQEGVFVYDVTFDDLRGARAAFEVLSGQAIKATSLSMVSIYMQQKAQEDGASSFKKLVKDHMANQKSLSELMREEGMTSNSERYRELQGLIKKAMVAVRQSREALQDRVQTLSGLPSYMFKELL